CVRCRPPGPNRRSPAVDRCREPAAGAGSMNGVPVARVLGFEVRLHLSWLFIVAVVTVTVADRLAGFQPEIDAPVSWIVGLIGSLGFMVSVVAHELAHAIAARRDGSDGDR